MLRLVLLIESPAESERVSGFWGAMNTEIKYTYTSSITIYEDLNPKHAIRLNDQVQSGKITMTKAIFEMLKRSVNLAILKSS